MSAIGANAAGLLVDNGTLEPAAIQRLRVIARALGEKLQCEVAPVSLQHSDRVPADQLDGRPGEVIEGALRRRLAAGIHEFVILPFFIGPTRALSEFLPAVLANLQAEFPQLKVHTAAPLHAGGEDALARILAMQVETVLAAEPKSEALPRVALVDHGSPVRAVTDVRNRIAGKLAQRLGPRAAGVAPCSMERRAGAEYDFNEPLLETLLTAPLWNAGTVVVAHLFLLPGRHAGSEGDVARICAQAVVAAPGLRTVRAGLLGDSPELLDILAGNYRALGRA
ncbi:MAG: cobalamin biosynthesis protein CbiX [Opitutaceae bacterium]|nr:cobalamin biosynthesis protein CbiX [Opitutaceae bacterium]MBP9913791.1 cobalamin biosynthesis protein CbiX [Opitutaceae bacterium]